MHSFKSILTAFRGSFKLMTRSRHRDMANEKTVFMTLEEAKKDPVLVKEIYKQLNEASFISGSQKEYMAGIKFKGRQFYISGRHDEWLSFYGA